MKLLFYIPFFEGDAMKLSDIPLRGVTLAPDNSVVAQPCTGHRKSFPLVNTVGLTQSGKLHSAITAAARYSDKFRLENGLVAYNSDAAYEEWEADQVNFGPSCRGDHHPVP